MNFVRLFPAIFSLLLLSAHFSRLGMTILSIICLIILLLLFIKKQWVAQLVQIVLLLGFLEWIRIMFVYVNERLLIGEPYFRLVIIISVVALFTILSVLVFRNKELKKLYNLK